MSLEGQQTAAAAGNAWRAKAQKAQQRTVRVTQGQNRHHGCQTLAEPCISDQITQLEVQEKRGVLAGPGMRKQDAQTRQREKMIKGTA